MIHIFAIAACAKPHVAPPDAAPDAPPVVVAVVDAAPPAPKLPPLSDESTIAIAATRIYVQTGSIKDPDAPLLEDAMRKAYARMRDEEEHDLLERADEGGLMMIAPPGKRGDTAAIFLHGWGGRFALPCWQVARALRVVTACPDAGVEGAWWSDEGERTVRQALEVLHAKHVVLVGLSNGASGAMRLPQKIAGGFEGVVLVSGANPIAGPAGIPTLVVHGQKDGMAPAEGARAYARKTGSKLVMLERGHFAMLLEADRFERTLAEFVDGVFSRAP